MGVHKVHLLSVSNFAGVALATFFAGHVFDWCSVDATTWRLELNMPIIVIRLTCARSASETRWYLLEMTFSPAIALAVPAIHSIT